MRPIWRYDQRDLEAGLRRTNVIAVNAPAMRRFRSPFLAVLIAAIALIASGCGSSKSAVDTSSTTTVPTTHDGTTKDGTTTDGTTTDGSKEDGSDDGGTGPVDPGTPRKIVDGDCGEVVADMTKAIEKSSRVQADAYAFRAFAKLCLGEDATDDLNVARDHQDELTADTREELTVVVQAHEPREDELRDLLRDVVPEKSTP